MKFENNIKKRFLLRVFIMIPAFLIIGIALNRWGIRLENRSMRNELLTQARLVERAINIRRILSLSGSETDIDLPDYKRLKEQLVAVRSANSKCRFIYLIGKRPDGKFFFFLDSELPDSKDYSPPGQVFDEISDANRNVFSTGKEIVEGPVSDRWGKWISALIPVVNPETGKIIAVLGIDIDAYIWMEIIFYRSLMLVIFFLLISILVGVFLYIQQRNERGKMRFVASHLALQDSENKYHSLFLTSSDAIMTLEPPSWKFTSGNPATVQMFKAKDEADFTSHEPWVMSPEWQPDGRASSEKAKEMIEMAMRDGSNFFEWTHKRINGEDFSATVLLTRMELAGETMLQATVRDISIQKQAEGEREKILQWQQDVAVLQQSLLATASLENKLKVITDSIVRIFDVDFCRIWLIRPGDLCGQGCIHAEVIEGPHVCRYRNNCLHLLASSGRYTHIDGKVHARVPFDCYKIGRVASSKDHKFLTNDVVNDPRVHNHEWARELGLVSFVGYQLRVPNGETIGVLALFAKHPILPTEDTILDSLSTTTAFITQQDAMDNNLKRQAQELDAGLKESLKSREILSSMLADNNQIREELEQRIEELKATYNKLKDVQSQLVQSSKMAVLGQLASGVAHEINNPLTGVLNNVQLIKMETEARKGSSISDFKELLDIVERSALRCKKITQSLLDFAHTSKGESLNISLNEIIKETLTIVEQELRLHNINFNKELQPDLPQIMGDPQLLQQAILDLINNAGWAIRKKSKGGGTITIKTGHAPEAKIVKISVSDTGIGIPQVNIPRLFTPFFTTKDVGEGTGLGLALSYNIIKSHNGDIAVESQVGVGTTFTITLPYL
ncbi:MAG: ATP-binding protein [Candidatus Omnitrophota bacterium]